MSVVEGVDVSGWQHPDGAKIDWAAVAKAGKRFAVVKATQGTTGLNAYLHEDAAGAKAAGLLVGAYHYATPNEGDGALQATWFLTATEGLDLALGLWLDIETDGSLQSYQVADWGKAFMETVAARTALCGVYCDDAYLGPVYQAPWGYNLWLAFSEIPPGVHPMIHQGQPITCPGIPAAVDPDVLLSYRGIDPPPTTGPSPVPQPIEDDDMGILVQAAGSADVYLVGGVPVVRQHVGPEQEALLLELGYQKKVDVAPAQLESITVSNGPPAAEEDATDPLGSTETAGTTDTTGDSQTAAESATEATEPVPTPATEATEGADGGEDASGSSGDAEQAPGPVVNPGWT